MGKYLTACFSLVTKCKIYIHVMYFLIRIRPGGGCLPGLSRLVREGDFACLSGKLILFRECIIVYSLSVRDERFYEIIAGNRGIAMYNIFSLSQT